MPDAGDIESYINTEWTCTLNNDQLAAVNAVLLDFCNMNENDASVKTQEIVKTVKSIRFIRTR